MCVCVCWGGKAPLGSHVGLLDGIMHQAAGLLIAHTLPETITGQVDFKNVVFAYPTKPDRIILDGISNHAVQ